jgi:hypothetical protein
MWPSTFHTYVNVTIICRQQAAIIQNHDNASHTEYKRLELGGRVI